MKDKTGTVNVVKVGTVPELEDLINSSNTNKVLENKNKSDSDSDSNQSESASESDSTSTSESESESESGSDSDSKSSSSDSSNSSKPMSSCSSGKISFNDDDIVRNDALYYILSKFFMSKDGSKNIVDVLMEIKANLPS